MRPNLFGHATKELSQDALICYLLDFYKGKNDYELRNSKECKLAENFIKVLLKKIGKEDLKIRKIDFKKQYISIDILLEINDEIYVIIEDKTFTFQGQNQMNKYRKNLINTNTYKNVTNENVYCIYYKTGDECKNSLNKIEEEENTFVILRDEIIEMFKDYSGENIVFQDYLLNLEKMKKERENFVNKDLRKEKLTWVEIIGFYNALDSEFKKLKDERNMPEQIGFDWDYTSNPNGGFMCYSFSNVLNFSEYGYYLQLECTDRGAYEEKIDGDPKENLKLVVKVWSSNKNINILYRSLPIFTEEWKNKKEINCEKPSRFASGKWMTQLIIKDYLVLTKDGKLDVRKTAESLVELLKELIILEKKLE